MHTFYYFLLFSLVSLKSFSQQQYYIYIQSDERQPFYVRMDEKIYSSSLSGYLILSNLNDGNYNLLIGFPKNAYPEHRFQVSLNNKDKGFQLKHNTDRTWQLVNLQSQAVIASTSNVSSTAELNGEKKTDAFSVMLANVVNDSTILYPQPKPQVVQTVAQQKPTSIPATAKRDTASATDREAEALVKKEAQEVSNAVSDKEKIDSPAVIVKIKEPEKPTVYEKKAADVALKEEKTAVPEKPFISKISEEITASAYKATYLEQYNYTSDTIDIQIPLESSTVATKPAPVVKEAEPKEAPVAIKKNDSINNDSTKSIVIQIGSIEDTFKMKKKIVMTNSDCKNFASDNDVDKLRVRILGEKDVDDKLSAARKIYKTRCFSVKQIRALTELFSSDETKYRFLDLSYAFTSDSGNYYLLEEVMKEDYYKNRFKAMIRK